MLTLTLLMLAPKPKVRTVLKKVKKKMVPWIETCTHYYQNESRQGESRTESLRHCRP